MPDLQPPTQLPGGARLAPGERPIVGDKFMLNTVVFYLHTQIALTNRRLYAMRPSTLLGLIPVGAARTNYPIQNIAGVSAATRFNLIGAVLGLICVLAGYAALSGPRPSGLGILLLIAGALFIINSPKQAVEVMNSGGGVIRFPVSVFERKKTVAFAHLVSEAIAGTPTRSDGDQAREPSPSNAGDAMLRLNQLRDQGLVTEAEYTAKRAEIIARL